MVGTECTIRRGTNKRDHLDLDPIFSTRSEISHLTLCITHFPYFLLRSSYKLVSLYQNKFKHAQSFNTFRLSEKSYYMSNYINKIMKSRCRILSYTNALECSAIPIPVRVNDSTSGISFVSFFLF